MLIVGSLLWATAAIVFGRALVVGFKASKADGPTRLELTRRMWRWIYVFAPLMLIGACFIGEGFDEPPFTHPTTSTASTAP